jgi:hypothetical protein
MQWASSTATKANGSNTSRTEKIDPKYKPHKGYYTMHTCNLFSGLMTTPIAASLKAKCPKNIHKTQFPYEQTHLTHVWQSVQAPFVLVKNCWSRSISATLSACTGCAATMATVFMAIRHSHCTGIYAGMQPSKFNHKNNITRGMRLHERPNRTHSLLRCHWTCIQFSKQLDTSSKRTFVSCRVFSRKLQGIIPANSNTNFPGEPQHKIIQPAIFKA